MDADHADEPAGSGVALEEVIPGTLSVRIFEHTIAAVDGPVSCWTYVSDGLWSLGQKEIVFTVQRRSGEARTAYPRDLLRLYALVHQFAGQHRIVDVGDFTTLNPEAALLGRAGFACVLYAPPQPLRDVRVMAPSLTALILTAGELAVAREYGVVRLMATVGRRYRHFPTAPWADRDRPELVSLREMEESFLAKVRRAVLLPASVRQENLLVSRKEVPGPGDVKDQVVTPECSRIVLRLRPGAARTLKELTADLPADSPLALLVGPEPSARSCLTWERGQQQPFAISAEDASGASVGGNFICFVPKQTEDKGVGVEDGFGVLLRDVTWQRIRWALGAGEPLSVPATADEGMGLELAWVPELDQDFVDRLESQIPGGWGLFGGGGPLPAAPAGPVRTESIVLLTMEHVMARRIETAAFIDYLQAITTAVESHLGAATAGHAQDLLIECELLPDGARTFRLAVRPQIAGNPAERLYEPLELIPPPPVVLGPVRFQLNLQLWGGSPRLDSTAPA